jgi:hypothetical protein
MARLTLNEHLFETLENITDKSIKGEELGEQIRRADAASRIATQIIANQNFQLKAALAALEHGVITPEAKSTLKLLTG